MNFVEQIKEKVRSKPGRLVLPEGTDSRVLKAASILVDERLVNSLFLIGDPTSLSAMAKEEHISLDNIILEDSGNKNRYNEYVDEYYNLRKHKGESIEKARRVMANPVYWGAMMVRKGRADAMVAGAINSTADVIRASLKLIKLRPEAKIASSCFVMSHPDESWGCGGQLIFSDCGVMPFPDAEQLAEIAIAAAASCRKFLHTEPIVALLSYSTKGSAHHPMIRKVRDALEIIKQKAPDLKVDGELQADAALVPHVADIKAPGSPVGGKANVLIFPDLAAGNIGYKLVQRLAGTEAYGPLFQGFAKPVSDLSRGCSVESIVNTSVLIML